MVAVIFYEKPGCINNTKQKALLVAAGHQVVACNLLDRWIGLSSARPLVDDWETCPRSRRESLSDAREETPNLKPSLEPL